MENKPPLRAVVWDWNGTLLDDVHVSLLSVNQELEARGLPPISREYYRQHFDFPVKDFYKKLGINFSRDNFDAMSERFLQTYFRNLGNASLHEGAVETLKMLQQHGIPQYVLSAMEQKRLEKMLEDYGISGFFKSIAGSKDIYADGKLAAGKELIQKEAIDPASAWMVGDTTHDLEVARELGLQCALLACGHQTRKRLIKVHPLVFDHFSELKNFFLSLL